MLARAAALALALAAPAHAQLGERNQLGVRVGHVHLLVRDVDANRRLFTELLGGKIVMNGTLELIEFPGLHVILTQAPAVQAAAGATVDHFGFFMKDFPSALARWKAAGATIEPTDNPNEVYLVTPDGTRVEVYGEISLPGPIYATHIHYYLEDVPATKAWYVKAFGANPGWRACIACRANPRMQQTADIGSLNLTLAPATTSRGPTLGHGIDHIGFDVENLAAFVTTLAARGIELDEPVREIPGTHAKSAFLTDPWGARIELTEGLAPR